MCQFIVPLHQHESFTAFVSPFALDFRRAFKPRLLVRFERRRSAAVHIFAAGFIGKFPVSLGISFESLTTIPFSMIVILRREPRAGTLVGSLFGGHLFLLNLGPLGGWSPERRS